MRPVTAVVVLAGCLAISGPGGLHAQDDAPKAPGKGYALRIVAVGDVYKGVRFKPATGEAWELLAGRWEKLAEADPPPAGDYEVFVVPVDPLLALRLDRKSGATWLGRGGKWTRVKEPPPPKAQGPAPGPGFSLRHVRLGQELHVVRFHTRTGDSWHVGRDGFEPLGEFGPVAAGDFDLTLIAGGKNWMGFRQDRKGGTTWLLRANTWHLVAEPE